MYIIIIITGLIFTLINYLIILKKKDGFQNNNVSQNGNVVLDYKTNLYDNLNPDVITELNEMYNIHDSNLLKNHNEKAKKYNLID